MPRVNKVNAEITRREPYIYFGELQGIWTGWKQLVIPIEADADFWCNQIVVAENNYSTRLKITDIRTGYNLTYPSVPWSFFARMIYALPDTFPAYYDRATPAFSGDLPKPYCFTRNGGILVEMEGMGAQAIYQIGFLGWKDYANAAE